MDTTLAYLREVLSNYTEDYALSRNIYVKLKQAASEGELAFVRSLDQEETHFLNRILPSEIDHALDEQDYTRMSELNHVYELLI
ncbi:sigma-G-dependent sporulation-specific acid-soluble spore protein CsgA [Bacillus pinisoli]|uniref:sigma-G-dependent sporulation-specific acid-soluble spore protein CsgA n=1 Tax=Bacillus pinisoli TaxID=2901866 RepID=UPI001FF24084|nr:sigma-G-dependent sporulation-specific acid-soluble spore protein CsgA [Bacillus pinisoli]